MRGPYRTHLCSSRLDCRVVRATARVASQVDVRTVRWRTVSYGIVAALCDLIWSHYHETCLSRVGHCSLRVRQPTTSTRTSTGSARRSSHRPKLACPQGGCYMHRAEMVGKYWADDLYA